MNSPVRTRCATEDQPFGPTAFTQKDERMMETDAPRVPLEEVVEEATRRHLFSADQFVVYGTLLEARAWHKPLPPAR